MFKGFLRLLGSFSVMSCAYFLPFTKIWGSFCSTFSWSSIAAPVASYHFGLLSVFSIVACKSFLNPQKLLIFMFFKRLPLLVSSWAFSSKNWINSLVIPAACVALFVAHPVGGQVFYYSFYWFIPMALYFIPTSIYSRSLSSTFVAHAVGSVVWLYFRNLGVEVWQLLMPMVIIERLLMASGMVGLHFVIAGAKQLYKNGITQVSVFRKSV